MTIIAYRNNEGNCFSFNSLTLCIVHSSILALYQEEKKRKELFASLQLPKKNWKAWKARKLESQKAGKPESLESQESQKARKAGKPGKLEQEKAAVEERKVLQKNNINIFFSMELAG